jgi:chlorite dismutase
MTAPPLVVSFVAGDTGAWRVDRMDGVVGESLPSAPRLEVIEGATGGVVPAGIWTLRGAVSNTRYTERKELDVLVAVQQGLGRPQATRAALIPIRKTTAWWNLAQDERRAIFEEQSHHIAVGLEYLPAVARRLHHSREFGEPFDFLTWFEFAPQDEAAFERLVRRLRETTEWKYVDREVDIRLGRD